MRLGRFQHRRAFARFASALLCIGLGLSGCDDGGDSPQGDGGAGDGGATDATDTADMRPQPDAAIPATPCASDEECADDAWCFLPPDALEGVCTRGCRTEPDNCEEGFLCGPERRCVVDPTCTSDLACPADAYCDAGTCRLGCRVGEFEQCPPTANGRLQLCDPRDRVCVTTVVCCGAGDACTEVLPSDCGDPVPGAAFCINPNPCEDRCGDDSDCADEHYCEAGQCARGCRLGGEDCPGEICDAESRRCRPTPCETDEACAADQFCDRAAAECALGCRFSPDSCEDGFQCTETRQCGEGCESDEQCARRNGEGWSCRRGECRPPCARDDQCGAGEVCEDSRCTEGCRNDAAEPNDTRETATRLNFRGGTEVNSGPIYAICPEDADWFTFSTPVPGYRIEVELKFLHARGDLDVRVHGPGGFVRAGQSATDDEVVVIEGAPAGAWHIEVYGRGFAQNTYALNVRLAPVVACAPDAAEPDDAPEAATRLAVDGARDVARIQDRTICVDDEDWFRLELGPGDGVRVELLLISLGGALPPGELEFAIYGPGMPQEGAEPTFTPLGEGGGVDGPRFYFFEAPRGNRDIAPGEYFVRVFGLSPAEESRYELRVTMDRQQSLCPNDLAEPNGDAAEAFDLLAHAGFARPGIDGEPELIPDRELTLPGLGLCGDEDWFRVRLSPGDALNAGMRRADPVVGAALIEILDADGVRVGSAGRGVNATITARANQVAGGVYFVRISADEGVTSPYALVLERAAAPQPCPADGLSPNQSRQTARLVEPGAYPDLTLCGRAGEEDWFAVQVLDRADLTVEIRFSHAQADLEVDVFRDEELVAENENAQAGHSDTDDERVFLAARIPGTYYVRVTARGAGDARYTLEVTVGEPVSQCEPDVDEPNDTQAQSVALGRDAVDRDGRWLCDQVPIDVDWYAFEVRANTTRIVAASFVFGDEGDLVLDAYDGAGERLASTENVARNNSKQCLIVEPHIGDRTLFLRVRPLFIRRIGREEQRLDYRLRIQDGADCEVIAPPAPGVVWPRVPPPF